MSNQSRKKKYCVYTISYTGKNQKKVVYVGQTQYGKSRWYGHLNDARNHSGYMNSLRRKQASRGVSSLLVHEGIALYGEDNFEFKIIKDGLTKAQARSYEKQFIRIYETYDKYFNQNKVK